MAAEARRAAEGKVFREAMSSGNAGLAASSSSGKSSGGGKVMQKLDLKKANVYKPPHTVLFHDPLQCRIRGFYGATRIGRGCGLAVGLDGEIRVVLEQMWALHERSFPRQKCPWDFSKVDVS